VVAAVVAVAVLVGFESSTWVHGQILESASRRPTPFTELYFSDHGRLPKDLALDQPSSFTFVVVNHEPSAVDYTPLVVLHGPGGEVPLPTDTMRVASGRSADQAVHFVVDQPGARYVVTVQLVGRPEVIHFSATS